MPVRLSEHDLVALGLSPTVDAGTFSWDDSCDGLAIGGEDAFGPRLMIAVPETIANSFLTVETPWGRRVKFDIKKHDASQKILDPVSVAKEGAQITLTLPTKVTRGQGTVPVDVGILNTSSTALDGLGAELYIGTGTFFSDDVAGKTFGLTPDHMHIEPGNTYKTTIQLRIPNVPGNYVVNAHLYLFTASDRQTLSRNLRSCAVLLRVQ